MAQKLKLLSPVGADPLILKWPVATSEGKEGPEEIVDTIRLVCEDFPELTTPLETRILIEGEDVSSYGYDETRAMCERYNKAIDSIRQLCKGSPRQKLFAKEASRKQLKHILQQCYNHSVKDPEKLNHYEPFSPEVYGETSFELVEQMIKSVHFSESDYFIDLGSGVGQVVLQVSAATNCKFCYGIEKAEWPAEYAAGMEKEFRRWMKWYGKQHGDFLIDKGDFLHDSVKEKLSKATIVFVNNFAFGPVVDHELKQRFANCLKEGARIVSSKAFCPLNFRITERNLSDIGTIMSVQELSPLCGAVSWTGKPFAYYVHTIDRTLLEKYFLRLKKPNGKREEPEPRKDRRGRPVASIKDRINGGLSGANSDSNSSASGRWRRRGDNHHLIPNGAYPPNFCTTSSVAKMLDFDSASNSSQSTSTTNTEDNGGAVVFGPTTRRQWNEYVSNRPASQSGTENDNDSSNAEVVTDNNLQGVAKNLKKRKKMKTIKRLNNGALGKKKMKTGRKKHNNPETAGSPVKSKAEVKLRPRPNVTKRGRRTESNTPASMAGSIPSASSGASSVSTTSHSMPKSAQNGPTSSTSQPSLDSLNLLHAHTIMSTSGKDSAEKVSYNDRRMTESQNAFFKPSVQKQTVSMLEKHAGFLQMIENMKQRYLSFLTFMQTPQYRNMLLLQIEQEKKKNLELKEKANQLEKDISSLQTEGVGLIKDRLKELGLKADTPRELLSQAKDVVLRNKELKSQAASLGAQINALQAEHNHKVIAYKKILDKKNQSKPLKNGFSELLVSEQATPNQQKLLARVDHLSSELRHLQEVNKLYLKDSDLSKTFKTEPGVPSDTRSTKENEERLDLAQGAENVQQNYETLSEVLVTLKSALQTGGLVSHTQPTTSISTSKTGLSLSDAKTVSISHSTSSAVRDYLSGSHCLPNSEDSFKTPEAAKDPVSKPKLPPVSVGAPMPALASSTCSLSLAAVAAPTTYASSSSNPATTSSSSSWTMEGRKDSTVSISSPRILPLGTKIDIKRPNRPNGLKSLVNLVTGTKPQSGNFTLLQALPRTNKSGSALNGSTNQSNPSANYTETEKSAAEELLFLKESTPGKVSISQSGPSLLSAHLIQQSYTTNSLPSALNSSVTPSDLPGGASGRAAVPSDLPGSHGMTSTTMSQSIVVRPVSNRSRKPSHSSSPVALQQGAIVSPSATGHISIPTTASTARSHQSSGKVSSKVDKRDAHLTIVSTLQPNGALKHKGRGELSGQPPKKSSRHSEPPKLSPAVLSQQKAQLQQTPQVVLSGNQLLPAPGQSFFTTQINGVTSSSASNSGKFLSVTPQLSNGAHPSLLKLLTQQVMPATQREETVQLVSTVAQPRGQQVKVLQPANSDGKPGGLKPSEPCDSLVHSDFEALVAVASFEAVPSTGEPTCHPGSHKLGDELGDSDCSNGEDGGSPVSAELSSRDARARARSLRKTSRDKDFTQKKRKAEKQPLAKKKRSLKGRHLSMSSSSSSDNERDNERMETTVKAETGSDAVSESDLSREFIAQDTETKGLEATPEKRCSRAQRAKRRGSMNHSKPKSKLSNTSSSSQSKEKSVEEGGEQLNTKTLTRHSSKSSEKPKDEYKTNNNNDSKHQSLEKGSSRVSRKDEHQKSESSHHKRCKGSHTSKSSSSSGKDSKSRSVDSSKKASNHLDPKIERKSCSPKPDFKPKICAEKTVKEENIKQNESSDKHSKLKSGYSLSPSPHSSSSPHNTKSSRKSENSDGKSSSGDTNPNSPEPSGSARTSGAARLGTAKVQSTAKKQSTLKQEYTTDTIKSERKSVSPIPSRASVSPKPEPRSVSPSAERKPSLPSSQSNDGKSSHIKTERGSLSPKPKRNDRTSHKSSSSKSSKDHIKSEGKDSEKSSTKFSTDIKMTNHCEIKPNSTSKGTSSKQTSRGQREEKGPSKSSSIKNSHTKDERQSKNRGSSSSTKSQSSRSRDRSRNAYHSRESSPGPPTLERQVPEIVPQDENKSKDRQQGPFKTSSGLEKSSSQESKPQESSSKSKKSGKITEDVKTEINSKKQRKNQSEGEKDKDRRSRDKQKGMSSKDTCKSESDNHSSASKGRSPSGSPHRDMKESNSSKSSRSSNSSGSSGKNNKNNGKHRNSYNSKQSSSGKQDSVKKEKDTNTLEKYSQSTKSEKNDIPDNPEIVKTTKYTPSQQTFDSCTNYNVILKQGDSIDLPPLIERNCVSLDSPDSLLSPNSSSQHHQAVDSETDCQEPYNPPMSCEDRKPLTEDVPTSDEVGNIKESAVDVFPFPLTPQKTPLSFGSPQAGTEILSLSYHESGDDKSLLVVDTEETSNMVSPETNIDTENMKDSKCQPTNKLENLENTNTNTDFEHQEYSKANRGLEDIEASELNTLDSKVNILLESECESNTENNKNSKVDIDFKNMHDCKGNIELEAVDSKPVESVKGPRTPPGSPLFGSPSLHPVSPSSSSSGSSSSQHSSSSSSNSSDSSSDDEDDEGKRKRHRRHHKYKHHRTKRRKTPPKKLSTLNPQLSLSLTSPPVAQVQYSPMPSPNVPSFGYTGQVRLTLGPSSGFAPPLASSQVLSPLSVSTQHSPGYQMVTGDSLRSPTSILRGSTSSTLIRQYPYFPIATTSSQSVSNSAIASTTMTAEKPSEVTKVVPVSVDSSTSVVVTSVTCTSTVTSSTSHKVTDTFSSSVDEILSSGTASKPEEKQHSMSGRTDINANHTAMVCSNVSTNKTTTPTKILPQTRQVSYPRELLSEKSHFHDTQKNLISTPNSSKLAPTDANPMDLNNSMMTSNCTEGKPQPFSTEEDCLSFQDQSLTKSPLKSLLPAVEKKAGLASRDMNAVSNQAMSTLVGQSTPLSVQYTSSMPTPTVPLAHPTPSAPPTNRVQRQRGYSPSHSHHSALPSTQPLHASYQQAPFRPHGLRHTHSQRAHHHQQHHHYQLSHPHHHHSSSHSASYSGGYYSHLPSSSSSTSSHHPHPSGPPYSKSRYPTYYREAVSDYMATEHNHHHHHHHRQAGESDVRWLFLMSPTSCQTQQTTVLTPQTLSAAAATMNSPVILNTYSNSVSGTPVAITNHHHHHHHHLSAASNSSTTVNGSSMIGHKPLS